jgi:hypothetical protein
MRVRRFLEEADPRYPRCAATLGSFQTGTGETTLWFFRREQSKFLCKEFESSGRWNLGAIDRIFIVSRFRESSLSYQRYSLKSWVFGVEKVLKMEIEVDKVILNTK